MATPDDQTAEGAPMEAHTFKGHPQPGPDERLRGCKNYLADEDVNRNLGFKERLAQIEEYIQCLEEKKTNCDKKLLRDVKTMAMVQQEWMDRFMDAPPCDKNACNPDYVPHISNRLISKEAGKQLREEREAMGLGNQTREDHAPFTIERNDEMEFLDRLKRDECENPDTVDEKTNLLWVENRAYGWVLREPSLIPVWLHPRLGLLNKGIKVTDEAPWYRQDGVLRARSARVSRRPLPQTLPDYLQYAQDKINGLLEYYAEGKTINVEDELLEDLLKPYELISLRNMRESLKVILENNPEPLDEFDVELDSKVKEKIEERRQEIKEAHRSWLLSFAGDGIQFMVGDEPVAQILHPGVFYVRTGEPSTDELSRLKRIEARANELLQMTEEQLGQFADKRMELLSYLSGIWTPRMRQIKDKISKLLAPVEANTNVEPLLAELKSEFFEASMDFLRVLLNEELELRYQRPGEIRDGAPNMVYIPWFPEEALLASEPSPLVEPTEDLKKLESDINSSLQGLPEVYPGNLRRSQQKALEKKLEKVMFPDLRVIRDRYLELKAEVKDRPSPIADAQYDDYKSLYQRTCYSWIDSFSHAGVKIRMAQPFQLDERPGILYLRDENVLSQSVKTRQILNNLGNDITEELQTKLQFQDDPEDRSLYLLLVNVQYPQLKQMDKDWRALANIPNPTDRDRRAAQEAKIKWRKTYNSWVCSFQTRRIVVRLPLDMADVDGDPSVVYYRGPLQRTDPDSPDSPGDQRDPPLTRRTVDHVLLLLNWFHSIAQDKVALAIQLDAVSALPPSLRKKLSDYNAAIMNANKATTVSAQVSTDNALEKKNTLISAFIAWERMIRDLGRPVPGTASTFALPPAHQQKEDLINSLLELGPPISEGGEDQINTLIEPYWEPQLHDLRERRKSRLREETDLTEEQIDLEDMSVGAFKVEIEYFKRKCRVHGFKIIKTPEGHFVAQDPPGGDFFIGRQQLEDFMYESESPPYPKVFTESMHTNQFREHVFEMEDEINRLLDIHKRSGTDDELDTTRDRFRSNEEEEKLIRLLRGFFPRRLAIAYRQLRGPSQLMQPSSAEEKIHKDRNKAIATKTFIDIYEPWIRRLMQSGVRIVLGSKDNIENNDDGTLYMNYKRKPDTDHSSAEDNTSEYTSNEEDNTTELLSPDLREIQDKINELLRFRRSRPLNLVEEKRLRCLLRAVMPQGLARLDDMVRSIGQVARGRHLSEHEVTHYFIETDRWRDSYYGWVDEFTKTGIRIKQRVTGEPFPPPTSNVMFLQLPPEQLPNDSSETASLPVHIQTTQDLLNDLLSGKVIVTKDQKRECENYIYSLWKPVGDNIRGRWFNKLYTEYNIKPHDTLKSVSTRLQAVVEAQILNSFSAFLEQVVHGPQEMRLEFVETRPETFTVVLDLGQAQDTVQNDTMLKDIINNALTIKGKDNTVPEALDRALKEFLPLAHKVRTLQTPPSAEPLTDAEREQVEGLLQPLSKDDVATMEKGITKLWQDLAIKGRLSKADQDRLKDLSVQQMWYMWASMNPELRDSTIAAVYQPEPVQSLLNPMRHGAVPTDPPEIDPPTEAEVLHLEAKINSLLDKLRNNWLTAIEKDQLEWLLRPLSPPSLRNLDRQIQELRWKSVGPGGLDTNESLKLAGFQTDLSKLFHRWIERIESFETLLNGWWFNPAIMQELFIHARQWDDAMKEATKYGAETETKAPSKTNKNTAGQKDDRLRIQHENFELLRHFTKNFEGSYHDKLLLEHMDPPLKALYEEIQSLRDMARSKRLEFDESLRLRIVTQDFVRDHMNWVASLTPEQIQTFRGNTVDFSAKAERRGVQRAAVELGLNLLATNQEQHRPHDRFRRLALPPKYQPPPEEVALWKPLDPWKRPVELDPFHYTKFMQKFRRWKEHDYRKARNRVINEDPGHLEPPANYNGPFALRNVHEMQETARKRQNHLLQISNLLLETNRKAPRPLLERICVLVGEAETNPPGTRHPLEDDIQLTTSDIDLLMELCEPSWNNESRPWGALGSMPGFPDSEPDFSAEVAMLEEFARDVENASIELPFWQPRLRANQKADPNTVEFFTQTQYNKRVSSATGVTVGNLQHNITTARRARASRRTAVHFWSKEETRKYLQAMHDYGRIHFDAVTELVSRIPPSGHPEHKYVLSEDDAKKASHIQFNKTTKKYEVQYNSSGYRDAPIVQPNKYEHLQQVAFRLGRDIRLLSEVIADVDDYDTTIYSKQFNALAKALQNMEEINPGHAAVTVDPVTGKELSLKMIAHDLLKYAPELGEDIGIDLQRDINAITTEQAAKIIQLQLIEESNNNWESRFPEDEHVWDWVDNPLPTTQPASDATTTPTQRARPIFPKQYFSLRRWPVECQSLAVQAMIKTSGPAFETDTDTTQTQPTEQVSPLTVAERRTAIGPYPRERYTGRGGPPNFPFGETPYQQAFQSFRMEEDLKDVEEFRRPGPPTGVINTLKRKLASPEPPVDQFALPTIPAEWNPTSVSVPEKRLDIIEKAKKTEGLPDTDDAYFTPAEIIQMERDKARVHASNERKRAKAEIVKHVGKPYSKLTRAEIRDWQDKLNIDPLTEQFRPDAAAAKKASAKTGYQMKIRKEGGETLREAALPPSSESEESTKMSGALGVGDVSPPTSSSGGSNPSGISNEPSEGAESRRSPRKKRTAADAFPASGKTSPAKKAKGETASS